jgi:hypothetical protein
LLSAQFARGDRDGLVMAARPAIGAEDRSLFDFLRAQAKQAALLEAERLLYVACTRAKWQLQLTATVNRRRRGGLDAALRKPAAGAVADGRRGLSGGIRGDARGGDVARDGAPRGGPLRRVPLDWSPARCPRRSSLPVHRVRSRLNPRSHRSIGPGKRRGSSAASSMRSCRCCSWTAIARR